METFISILLYLDSRILEVECQLETNQKLIEAFGGEPTLPLLRATYCKLLSSQDSLEKEKSKYLKNRYSLQSFLFSKGVLGGSILVSYFKERSLIYG